MIKIMYNFFNRLTCPEHVYGAGVEFNGEHGVKSVRFECKYCGKVKWTDNLT